MAEVPRIPRYTPEQEAALSAVVEAFGVQYSRDFCVRLKVHQGEWTEAEVSPNERLVRRSEKRRKV
jgi:hypothetical protein